MEDYSETTQVWDEFVGVSRTIVVIIYRIAFIFISYGVFQECQHDRHAWVLANIFNGIGGGVLLVYPFNIIKYGATNTLYRWVFWLWVSAVFTGGAMVLGAWLGLGTWTPQFS